MTMKVTPAWLLTVMLVSNVLALTPHQHRMIRRETMTHYSTASWSLLSPSSAKELMLELLGNVPRNAPTPGDQTRSILRVVRMLEQQCPTPNAEVLPKLGGSWELLWTAQDPDSPESRRPFRSWINPIENQSYSNNPGGQANPFLPVEIQTRLEQAGFATSAPDLRSIQAIDLANRKVRNVVNMDVNLLGEKHRASMTVTVDFNPSPSDPRKIDVKFIGCRMMASKLPLDWHLPLGVFGPTGWLRTVYIDDTIRVTRGHKGSVFILQRPQRKKAEV